MVVLLALAAASAFALSVQAGHWWSIGDVEIGPFGSQSPFSGRGGLSWLGASPRWARLGIATGAAGLIAMFVLVIVAGATAAKRTPRLMAKTSLVSIATAVAAGAGFFFGRPDNGMPFAIGSGVAWFAAGVVLGVASAALVLREPAPVAGPPSA